jgi:2-oxoglutarate ferredoxin oxidoreductase subunit alpha
MPVYAPASIQETVDLVMEAFEVADLYRTPVMILGDGMIGQMMESVEFREPKKRELQAKDWALVGTGGKRKPNIVNSLLIEPDELEAHIEKLFKKYDEIKKNETLYEKINCEDADVVAVAYGTISRVVRNAIKKCEAEGIKLGLIRPITLWPFPFEAFEEISPKTKAFLSVEMSAGQMIDDVKIASNGRLPVEFYGRNGGNVPQPDAVVDKVIEILGGGK